MNVKSITSAEAYQKLVCNENCLLIDVRTPEEWRAKGIPQINNKVEFISWPPRNDQSSLQIFISSLKQIIERKNAIAVSSKKEQIELFFICKAGIRSAVAAEIIANKAMLKCYNIIDGFEGSTSGEGWKNNNLPWQRI